MKLKQILIFLPMLAALIISCDWIGEDKKNTSGIQAAIGDMVIANSDYTTGSLSALYPSELASSNEILNGDVDADLKVRSFNGLIYVLNNTNGNIQLINPDGFSTVKQQSTGSGSYPHDIIVSGTKAYVSLNGSSKLWIINPLTLAKTAEIDLSAYTPSGASSPSLSQMWFDSGTGYLYAAAQRIAYDSSYTATIDYSSVIVIDTATDQIVSEIKLQWTANAATVNAKNPYSRFVYADSSSWSNGDGHAHIFILCAGLYDSATYADLKDGGIIAIDTTDLHIEPGYIVSEADLDNAISDFDMANGIIYAAANDGSSSSYAYRINPSDIASRSTIKSISGTYSLPFIKSDSAGNLYIGDRTSSNPGIWVYDTAASAMKTTSIISTGIAPYDITVIK